MVERVEAASQGKGTTVKVKRQSLAQLAQLEKVNSEFQAKCSTQPELTTAMAKPMAPTAPPKVVTVAKRPTAVTASGIAPKN